MWRLVKIGVMLFALLLVVAVAGWVLYAYYPSYLGEEHSPNKEYTLRYYSYFEPFKIYWSMPGGSSCKPALIRLYDKSGTKLNELHTTDCSLEMQVYWIDQKVFLPDGDTMWDLPSSGVR